MFSVNKCDSYDSKIIKKSLNFCLAELGGLDKFIKKEDTVLIKPNLLMPAVPERAVSTHPEIIKVLINKLNKIGCKIIIADSSSGDYSFECMENVYKECGYSNFKEISNDFSSKEYQNKSGFIKKYDLISAFFKADKIINVCKVKTHMLTTMTCAVKNLFGLIAGKNKTYFHSRFSTVDDFSKMLIDLAKIAKPCLNIADGVFGMEGEGPSRGKIKKLGIIAASTDCFELDYNISKIIGIDYKKIPYLKLAKDYGLFKENNKNYSDYKTQFKIPNSELISKLFKLIPPKLRSIYIDFFVKKPFIKDTCIGCGLCAKSCPAKAISIIKGKAKINYSKCIRCYCCHEICRYNAVGLRKGKT
ncbi:MAG: DUF362 domain-containing protein [Candidatus Nanoarchaeia archaeon]|nr:DUF362 domain-containing protein [Candidatus Nanoarchaeia archaeon]